MDQRHALPWALAAAFAGLSLWALTRGQVAVTAEDARGAQVERLLRRVDDLERQLAERSPPLLAAAPAPIAGAPSPTGKKAAPVAPQEQPTEATPVTLPEGSHPVQLTPEVLARWIDRGQGGYALVNAKPVPPPDELRRLLESTIGPAHDDALASLARAPSAAYLPLLSDTLNARDVPKNVRELINRTAELKDRAWSAVQATGAPDTPIDGDLGTAWASRQPEMGEQTLDLTYARAVRVDEVRIHETLAPGAVSRIQAKQADGTWETIWEGVALVQESPRWFEPPVARTGYATNAIRLVIDTDRVAGWNEIDAVELVGDGLRQWASGATASSSYGDGGQ